MRADQMPRNSQRDYEPPDDGGPAFPPNAGWRDDDPNCRGMTLRDYFAAKAMQSVLQRLAGEGLLREEVSGDFVLYGKISYAMADAMLKAREES